ncbi:glycylpeptide N-tetradecanoyltransferase [Teratosphaeriaceae sp. CCFEE 6253]|nr:glycylpeptide N-tetradecanoyltransferase [Teratosphaeriaceae sp. CCFEE 6253]
MDLDDIRRKRVRLFETSQHSPTRQPLPPPPPAGSADGDCFIVGERQAPASGSSRSLPLQQLPTSAPDAHLLGPADFPFLPFSQPLSYTAPALGLPLPPSPPPHYFGDFSSFEDQIYIPAIMPPKKRASASSAAAPEPKRPASARETDVTKDAINVRNFVAELECLKCVTCGHTLVAKQGLERLLVRQFSQVSMSQRRPTVVSALEVHSDDKNDLAGLIDLRLLCPKCKESHTCIGCGKRVSHTAHGAQGDGIAFAWHCDRARLSLIWFLLCGYDNQVQHNKPLEKSPKEKEARPARGRGGHRGRRGRGEGMPSGVGYGGGDGYYEEEHMDDWMPPPETLEEFKTKMPKESLAKLMAGPPGNAMPVPPPAPGFSGPGHALGDSGPHPVPASSLPVHGGPPPPPPFQWSIKPPSLSSYNLMSHMQQSKSSKKSKYLWSSKAHSAPPGGYGAYFGGPGHTLSGPPPGIAQGQAPNFPGPPSGYAGPPPGYPGHLPPSYPAQAYSNEPPPAPTGYKPTLLGSSFGYPPGPPLPPLVPATHKKKKKHPPPPPEQPAGAGAADSDQMIVDVVHDSDSEADAFDDEEMFFASHPAYSRLGHRKRAESPVHEDPDDLLTTQVMAAISLLLPSLSRPENEMTAFDYDPERLCSMLLRSSLVDRAAELLRNDSVEDAARRGGLYESVLHFVKTLATHFATIKDIVLDERPINRAGHDLLKVSSGMPTRLRVEEAQTSQPLYACMAGLHTQSKIVIKQAQTNELEYATDEGQQMLWICRSVCDLVELVEATNVHSETKTSEPTISVDSMAWQKELGMLEVPDEMILSSHIYGQEARTLGDPPPGRMRQLVKEITRLKTGLPPGIFVRYGESRMDVMKILIVGPKGTPYENGLWEFDLLCGIDYPNKAPKMSFRTTGGGLARVNPNLYNCGKICLSLLGTWSGEPWRPGKSTLLQVLVSIQAMIFCDEPHCNEPSYEGDRGSEPSRAYNRNVYAMTVKLAMLEWLDMSVRLHYALALRNRWLGESADAPVQQPYPGSDALWAEVVTRHFETHADEIAEMLEAWVADKPAPRPRRSTRHLPNPGHPFAAAGGGHTLGSDNSGILAHSHLASAATPPLAPAVPHMPPGMDPQTWDPVPYPFLPGTAPGSGAPPQSLTTGMPSASGFDSASAGAAAAASLKSGLKRLAPRPAEPDTPEPVERAMSAGEEALVKKLKWALVELAKNIKLA